MDRNDIPIAFGFALAQNPDSMKAFSNLPESRQTEILHQAHNVSSKEDMQALVDHLSAQ